MTTIDEMPPLFALGRESINLKLTYVEPHYTFSDEVEIDPLDERDGTTDEVKDIPRVVVWDILEVAEPIDDRRPWAREWPRQTHRTTRRGCRGPHRGRVQALVEAAGKRGRRK